MESGGNHQPSTSRRKPQKTCRIAAAAASAGWTDSCTDVVFTADDDVVPTQTTVAQRPSVGKTYSDPLNLPEGTVIVQPEDASDCPFQGPEFLSSMTDDGGVYQCTMCNQRLDVSRPASVQRHSLLNVLLCKRCYTKHEGRSNLSTAASRQNYCRWCSAGLSLVCCDSCDAMFCKTCIRRNLGQAFLESILSSEGEEAWNCFLCDVRPISSLVQTCQQVMQQVDAATRSAGKRRKSATTLAQKRTASLSPGIASSLPQKRRISAGQLGSGKTAAVGARVKEVNGEVKITRPVYTADMMPVNEMNVGPVMDKLLAATQSMSMLLGSLKDDLQRSAAALRAAAATPDTATSTDGADAVDKLAGDVAIKKREAAVKLWRAFTAYQQSFVDIEGYTRSTSQLESQATPATAQSNTVAST